MADGLGAIVQVGGPNVSSASVAGEVTDGVSELFVCCPTVSDVFDLAGLAGRRGDARQASLRLGGGGNEVGNRLPRRAAARREQCPSGQGVKRRRVRGRQHETRSTASQAPPARPSPQGLQVVSYLPWCSCRNIRWKSWLARAKPFGVNRSHGSGGN